MRSVLDIGDIRNIKLDSSDKLLIFGNIVTIVMALIFNYPLAALIWLYWMESVIIGFFAFFKILLVRGEGHVPFLKRVPFALFFTLHYGGFHAGYFMFLFLMPWFTPALQRLDYIIAGAGILFITHGFSFIIHVLKEHEGREEKLVELQFTEPYVRIIPMHLTIIASGFVMGIFAVFHNFVLLIVFMAFKTASDLFFHKNKHRMVSPSRRNRI